MSDFSRQYAETHATLGLDLTEEDAVSDGFISRFERKMKFRLPRALRDYYLVAGNELDSTRVFQELIRVGAWWLDEGRLVFMEDEQAAVVWGVDLVKRPLQDPPVFQGVNVDENRLEWHLEHEQCSIFLKTMLHWQGAYGGAMPYTATAIVTEQLRERLDAEWVFVGEVNGMRAYNRPHRAICFLKWEDDWRVFAGAARQSLLNGTKRELGLKWTEPVF